MKTYIRRLGGWLRATPSSRLPHQSPSPRLGVETLEERLALSTVSIANRVLTYQAAPGEVNSLQISRSGNTFTFAETGGVAIRQGNGLFPSVTANSTLFDRIQVNLGDRNDRASILSTNRRIDVLGQSGNDTVTVGTAGRGMEDILAQVNVDGGTQFFGTDELILADLGAPAVTPSPDISPNTLSYGVNSTFVTRQRVNAFKVPLTSATVSYSNLEGLSLDASNQADRISVVSTALTTPVTINARGGDDAIFTGNMDLLAGRVAVRGGDGTDALTVSDSGAATNRNYTIKTDSLSRVTAANTAIIDLDSLEGGLKIQAPNKVNSFDVQSLSAFMPVTLVGGALSDTVTVSDSANTLGHTYSLEANKVVRTSQLGFFPLFTGQISHFGVDRLVVNAGQGGDTFRMTDTIQPSLGLSGGLGVDTIDYSAFTTNVTVNMAVGNATKVAGGLFSVENATGGAGADILVGDANANVLVGKAGRDVLIGGRGADTLLGGAGEDLMIAGATVFDGNSLKLNTIRNGWAGSGTATARSNSLKQGVGFGLSFVKLDDTTVRVTGALDDAARDVLQPHDEGLPEEANTPDWFWANPGNFAPLDQLSLLAGDIFK